MLTTRSRWWRIEACIKRGGIMEIFLICIIVFLLCLLVNKPVEEKVVLVPVKEYIVMNKEEEQSTINTTSLQDEEWSEDKEVRFVPNMILTLEGESKW
jgi:hypothetical protein